MSQSQPVTTVYVGDIILFRDPLSKEPVENGVNQVAVVVDARRALFVRGCQVREIRLEEVLELPELMLVASPHRNICDHVAEFFKRHECQPAHFQAGLVALREGNIEIFERGTLFPTRRLYGSQQEYEVAWDALKSKLRPMDIICTTSTKNPLSRFIAWATHGPWSHVAGYLGSGEISESNIPGMRRASIDTFRSIDNWIAAYRHVDIAASPMTEAAARDAGASVRGKYRDGYNYRKAIYYGWRAFLGDHSHALTPNSMIYRESGAS